MKIKYQFINESIEIEVSDEWGELLIEFDRQDHNNDRRETRRHTTLDNGYGDGEWLAFDQELDELLSRKETAIHVRAGGHTAGPFNESGEHRRRSACLASVGNPVRRCPREGCDRRRRRWRSC